MTAQIAETLLYEGRKVSMCSHPLGDYFALADTYPGFAMNCTALWRGSFFITGWQDVVDVRKQQKERKQSITTWLRKQAD